MSNKIGGRRVSVKINKNISLLDETLFDAIDHKNDIVERQKDKLKLTEDVVDNRGQENAAKKEVYMSPKKVTDYYQTCIKLCAENKINTKNAFNLHLIDYMSDIVKSESNNDETNFQIASYTLDAGAKIYSYRVDGFYTDTYKLLNTLHQKDHKDVDNEDEGDDLILPNKEDNSKKVKKKVGSQGCNIEKNLKNIQRTKIPMIRYPDPLFRKISESFDAGSTKGLFLINTLVTSEFGLEVDPEISRLYHQDVAKIKGLSSGQGVEKMDEKCVSNLRACYEKYLNIDHKKLKLCSKTEALNFAQNRECDLDISRKFDEMRLEDDNEPPCNEMLLHETNKNMENPEIFAPDIEEEDGLDNEELGEPINSDDENDDVLHNKFEDKTLVPDEGGERLFAPPSDKTIDPTKHNDCELNELLQTMASRHPDFSYINHSIPTLPIISDLRQLRPRNLLKAEQSKQAKTLMTTLRKKRVPHTLVFTEDLNYWPPEPIDLDKGDQDTTTTIRTYDTVFKKAPSLASISLTKRALANMAAKPQIMARTDPDRSQNVKYSSSSLKNDLLCLNLLPNLKIKLNGKNEINLELMEYTLNRGRESLYNVGKRKSIFQKLNDSDSGPSCNDLLTVERLSYIASFAKEKIDKEKDTQALGGNEVEIEGEEIDYEDDVGADNDSIEQLKDDEKLAENTFQGMELLKPIRKIENLVVNYSKRACTTDIRFLKFKAWHVMEESFTKQKRCKKSKEPDPQINDPPSSPILFSQFDKGTFDKNGRSSISFSEIKDYLFKDNELINKNNPKERPFSDPILFITLLFLANEKNLHITFNDKFSDFVIHEEMREELISSL